MLTVKYIYNEMIEVKIECLVATILLQVNDDQ